MPARTEGRQLVVGMGATGLSVARFLAREGIAMRVVDTRSQPPALEAMTAICGADQIVSGRLSPALLDDCERVIVSPGLSPDLPLLAAARARGMAVIGDIELFARAADKPTLAVTGSNGKSTVTTLVAEMLRSAGLRAPAGGNLGPPALDLLAEPADAYVLEISSFQMETTESLQPLVATVLNISSDHLDRHGDIATYAALKQKLLRAASLAVINLDDPRVSAMADGLSAVRGFSMMQMIPRGYCLGAMGTTTHIFRDGAPLINVTELGLQGRHNLANAMAALALSEPLLPDPAPALQALRQFRGLPHRCQLIADGRGVRFINDSKATNVAAAAAAIQAFTDPIVLIAGGDAKGADLGELAASAAGRLRAAVVIGAAAAALERALQPDCPVYHADDMAEAVAMAAHLAVHGDIVLLSPACSSLDMYRDYRERGEQFAAAAREAAR